VELSGLDAQGNAFVTGDAGTVKFDRDGNLLWVASETPAASLRSDTEGNVYVSSYSKVVKYAPVSGGPALDFQTTLRDTLAAEGRALELKVTLADSAPFGWQWTRNGVLLPGETNASLRLDKPGLADAGLYAVEISDSTGLVARPQAVVTFSGPPVITSQPHDESQVSGGSVRFAVVAQAAGPLAYQWRRDGVSIVGATRSELILTNVQPSLAGRFVAGSVMSDAARLRVFSQAVQSVLARFRSEPFFFSAGQVIALDAQGSIVVGGRYGQYERSDLAVWKLDSQGAVLWSRFLGGQQYGYREASAIQVNPGGEMYLACGLDFGIAKLSARGQELWRGSGSTGRPYALASDVQGNVYLTGADADAGQANCGTVKYSATGQRLWTRREPLTGIWDEGGRFVMLDYGGDVWVAGDAGTFRYRSNGATVWKTQEYRDSALTLDLATNLFVGGHFANSDGTTGYAIRRYDAEGMKVWETRVEAYADRLARLAALRLDSSERIVVAG
jgi:hypothetical protein